MPLINRNCMPLTTVFPVRRRCYCCQVALRLRGSVSSKQLGYEELLAPLIAEACIDVVPTNPHNFNVDNVRIVKILGG